MGRHTRSGARTVARRYYARMSNGGIRGLSTALAAAAVVLLAPATRGVVAASPPETSQATHPAAWALLEKRCFKCHNSVDWAGGVAFDTMAIEDIPADAEIWEKAVRKLRGRMMPPPGEVQPEQATIDHFVAWMEGELDRAADAHPDPGNVGLHRLNRTEYRREIERLLGLDVDVKTLLPKDVSSDGFDNVAAVLRISPTFLDQYITAARAVSRQAIGRASAKPSSRQYRVNPGSDQLEHIDGLPLGTRGGMLIEHYFPADGEYDFNIREFFFGGAGYVTRVDQPHRVVMTIDDVRVFEQEVGGSADLKAVDQRQAEAADELQSRFNDIRVKIKAGPHRVGVTFVQRSFAQSDSPLQPIAALPEMERYPTIPGVDISGPFNVAGVGDTESRRRVFACHPESASEELPCAQRILARLATEAFRRPVTDADLEAPLAFYTMGRETGDFEAGIESGLTAILSSTKFLFRAEAAPADGAPARVSDLELASRLSFFLWSEGPDDALIGLATAGRLRDAGTLDAQVHRMLADPRSQSLVTNFAFQWLDVNRIETTQPDPVLYPDFDPELRAGFREEIRLFLDSILRGNRSALDLLRSDQTFLNERVALHYGVPNVRGAQFRPVRLTDPNRFGLFGKGAVLMATSYGNRTSPVLRGAWILENITGTPPTAPPPGVEAFKETEPGKKPLTVRERLEQHRAQRSCKACHGVIDPLGFALENYDVVGAWRNRDRDAGSAIDSSGQLSSGLHVSGPAQLDAALLARPDQFVQALTEKLMVFALGRGLRYQDMPAVRAIVRSAAGDDYRFEAIVAGIVRSPAFQMRQLPATPPTQTTQAALMRADRAR
jgi:hypothetical protein